MQLPRLRIFRLVFFEEGDIGKLGILLLGVEGDSRTSSSICYSQRNTFAESAVHTINTTVSAATS
jgi:hypothetical protein